MRLYMQYLLLAIGYLSLVDATGFSHDVRQADDGIEARNNGGGLLGLLGALEAGQGRGNGRTKTVFVQAAAPQQVVTKTVFVTQACGNPAAANPAAQTPAAAAGSKNGTGQANAGSGAGPGVISVAVPASLHTSTPSLNPGAAATPPAPAANNPPPPKNTPAAAEPASSPTSPPPAAAPPAASTPPSSALESSVNLGGLGQSTPPAASTPPVAVNAPPAAGAPQPTAPAANNAAQPNIDVNGLTLKSALSLGNLVQQTMPPQA